MRPYLRAIVVALFVVAAIVVTDRLMDTVVPSICQSLSPDDTFWWWWYGCAKDSAGGGGGGAG